MNTKWTFLNFHVVLSFRVQIFKESLHRDDFALFFFGTLVEWGREAEGIFALTFIILIEVKCSLQNDVLYRNKISYQKNNYRTEWAKVFKCVVLRTPWDSHCVCTKPKGLIAHWARTSWKQWFIHWIRLNFNSIYINYPKILFNRMCITKSQFDAYLRYAFMLAFSRRREHWPLGKPSGKCYNTCHGYYIQCSQ